MGGHCKVMRVAVSPATLSELLARARHFREQSQALSVDSALRAHLDPVHTEDSRCTAAQLDTVLRPMEEYLRPLLPLLSSLELRLQPPVAVPDSGRLKGKDRDRKMSTLQSEWPAQPEAAEHLVLLVDRPLLQLPLEGLPALRDAAVTSVSRDLSLHMLSNRLRLDEAVEAGMKREGKSKDFRKKTSSKKGTKVGVLCCGPRLAGHGPAAALSAVTGQCTPGPAPGMHRGRLGHLPVYPLLGLGMGAPPA